MMSFEDKLEMRRIIISSNIPDERVGRFNELLNEALKEAHDEGYAEGSLSIRNELIEHHEAYSEGFKAGIKFISERDMIDCDCCPCPSKCTNMDLDCWDAIVKTLEESKNGIL